MDTMIKTYLCSTYGLGMDDVEELFGLGVQTVRDCLGILDSEWQGGDMATFVEAMHTLKGALFNMGLEALGEQARRLELAGKAGDTGLVRQGYPAFRDEVGRIG